MRYEAGSLCLVNLDQPDCLPPDIADLRFSPFETGLSDIGRRSLGEAYVHVHNRRSRDVLPDAPCLQPLQFMHCSQPGSEKSAFVPPEV